MSIQVAVVNSPASYEPRKQPRTLSSIFRRRNSATRLESQTGIDSTQVSSGSGSSSSESLEAVSEDSLPSYAAATIPKHPVTYHFSQSTPFSMQLTSSEGMVCYTISLGANVWMPTSAVTFVYKGQDGHLISRIEMGISANAASITMGGQTLPLSDVFSSRNPSSKTRLQYVSSSKVIKWSLQSSPLPPTVWTATLDSTPLGFFSPLTQHLTLHPLGHPWADHIVTALVVLMREWLTPGRKEVGDAEALFSYRRYPDTDEQ